MIFWGVCLVSVSHSLCVKLWPLIPIWFAKLRSNLVPRDLVGLTLAGNFDWKTLNGFQGLISRRREGKSAWFTECTMARVPLVANRNLDVLSFKNSLWWCLLPYWWKLWPFRERKMQAIMCEEDRDEQSIRTLKNLTPKSVRISVSAG